METFSAATICGGTGPGDTPLDCCPVSSGIIPKIEIATQKDGSLRVLKIGLPVKMNSIPSDFIVLAKSQGFIHSKHQAKDLFLLCQIMSKGASMRRCIQQAVFIKRKPIRASSCLVHSERASASPSFNQFTHSGSRASPWEFSRAR